MKWKAIITDKNLKEKITNKILEIDSDLSKTIIKEENFAFSLLSGYFGLALFNAYLFKFSNSESHLNQAHSYLQIGINKRQTNSNHSFCNGVAGVIWCLNHLFEMELISSPVLDLTSNNGNILLNKSLNDITLGNYDYLHGGLGMVLTALLSNRDDKNINSYLKRVVIELENSAIDSQKYEKCVWLTSDNENQKSINLGLSHGVPSIITILSLLYSIGIEKSKCHNMINNAIKLMLNSKLPNKSLSVFPYSIILEQSLNNESSRLGWCYGDLGIAFSIWHAGRITNNLHWQKEAINIMHNAAKRVDLIDNLVSDAGLCHGSAGIAHIFNRFYQYTNIEEFKNVAIYWYKITLDFAQFEDGIGNFKMYIPRFENENEKWENSPDLLEGSAGIGLALLAAISDEEPKWDRCLLLS